MRLLLINPNTSEFVTRAVAKAARQAALPDTEVVAVTGKRGAPIISGRTENALGAVESINLAAEHAEGCDAVLLAVSFDSGLKPLRELLNIPVAGMSEAAMLTACMLGGRFALVSFGDRAAHLYRELAFEYGLGERLAGVRALPALTQEELESPERVAPRLIGEIDKAVREQGAEAVVLAGAVFAGLSGEIARAVASAGGGWHRRRGVHGRTAVPTALPQAPGGQLPVAGPQASGGRGGAIDANLRGPA